MGENVKIVIFDEVFEEVVPQDQGNIPIFDFALDQLKWGLFLVIGIAIYNEDALLMRVKKHITGPVKDTQLDTALHLGLIPFEDHQLTQIRDRRQIFMIIFQKKFHGHIMRLAQFTVKEVLFGSGVQRQESVSKINDFDDANIKGSLGDGQEFFRFA